MNFQRIVLIVFLVFEVIFVSGQKIRRTNNFDNYKDHVQEFGYAINLSYLKYEKTFSPQLHLHYSHYINKFFSLGIGYSGIYDEHYHNTLTLEGGMRFYKHLIFSLKPGVVIKRVHGNLNTLYSVGFESNYEFDINETVHIGPMVEYVIVQDDVNYLVGFHMGLTF